MSLKDINALVKKTLSRTNPDIVFDPNRTFEVISSGHIVFDLLTGIGGLPRGRIIEIIGMESSGKSSLCYLILATAVKAGLKCVLLDAEQSWDPAYGEKVFGLVQDGENFSVYQPQNYEECDNILDILIKQKEALDLIICDSIEAMKPRCIIENSADKEQRVGAHAKAMGAFVIKMKNYLNWSRAVCIGTNQLRSAINTKQGEQPVGTASGYNVQETMTTPGGLAWRFYASMRFKTEFGGQLGKSEVAKNIQDPTGLEQYRAGKFVKLINLKNKCSTPELKGLSQFDFPNDATGEVGGWNLGKDTLRLLENIGRVQQKGTKFIYNGLHLDWDNVGSKESSENLFISDENLMKDARDLIHSMRNKKVKPLVEKAVQGEDFDSSDTAPISAAELSRSSGIPESAAVSEVDL